MYRYSFTAWALPMVVLCAAPLTTPVFAQATMHPDPAEAGRPAPPIEYQSVFSGYQPFREQKGNAWKEVNKEVADNPGMGKEGMPGIEGKPPMDHDMSKGAKK